MGYGEYFNLCDDIGAEPLPCLNVGLTCQGRNNYDFNVDAHEKLSMTDEDFRQYLIDVRGYWPTMTAALNGARMRLTISAIRASRTGLII
jgi:hypothetical protein